MSNLNLQARRKIMLVFGTRPEAIKMAPLVHALRAAQDAFDVRVCVTAQHRQMLDQVLKLFNIVPDIDLDLMKPGQDLYDVTTAVLLGMRNVLRTEQPDILLVHGDTTTTFAAATAAYYQGITVGHVEAGLRTWDLHAPFPEEFNRQVVSRLARLHFAPTQASRDNLLAEHIAVERVYVTGNTVIDALHWVLDRIESDPIRARAVEDRLDSCLTFRWQKQRFILITGHRRENFGAGFLAICQALRSLALRYPAVHFVYPVHLNPNVQVPVHQLLAELDNVHLIETLDYEPFVVLMSRSYLVLTDSGGIQEEAPSLGKPVLVMRDVTERLEAVHAGTVRLVGARQERIESAVTELLEDVASYEAMSRANNPYGDGMACSRIVDALRNY
jgi:UDP-N-acetylglucosamine 2-epimerase (non-hydrolysing)